MGRLGYLALAALLTFSGCTSLVMLSASPDPWIGHFIISVSSSQENSLSASQMAPYRKVLVAKFIGKQGDEVARFMREGLMEKGYLAFGPFLPDSVSLLSLKPAAFQEAEAGVSALLDPFRPDAILVGKSLQDTTGPLEVKLFMELLDAREGRVIWFSVGQYKSGRFFGNYDYFAAMRFLVGKALKGLPRLAKEASSAKRLTRHWEKGVFEAAQFP